MWYASKLLLDETLMKTRRALLATESQITRFPVPAFIA